MKRMITAELTAAALAAAPGTEAANVTPQKAARIAQQVFDREIRQGSASLSVGHATRASTAETATTAGHADTAGHAATASHATTAGHATAADTAEIAEVARAAESALGYRIF